MNYDNEELNEKEGLENLESQESGSDELKSENILDKENEKNPEEQQKEKIKALIKKKVLTFLLTHPILIVILIAVIFLFFLIVLIAMDFDMGGTGHIKSELYSGTICKTIRLSWEDNKEYNLNKYIAGIVWKDNQNAGDVNNEKVYELMAIATRSRIISSVSDDCVLSSKTENYTELTGKEEKYEEINKAVNNTKTLIIARDKKAINAKYDAFSYTKKSQENKEGKSKIGVYHMMNKNIEGEQLIPADWVEEHNIKTQKVFQSTKLESMSLFGAKYLLEKADSPYDIYRTLEYYYGEDINYYTLEKEYNNLTCSSIDMYKTPLKRDEFINLANSYLSSKSSITAKLFRENAGLIYDIGLEVDANPEMAYIIATKEYQWADTHFTLSCNNFYGYAVYNGQTTGKCFSSFEDGVRTILQYVHDKGSLDAFTKVYSYLGTYLANPGSWGDGGCIYLKLDEIFGPNYSRCNGGYHCASSRGGPGCVLTTEEEKQAYIDWQGKIILKHRANIFQLSEDKCNDSSVQEVPTGEAASIPLENRMSWLFPNGLPNSESECSAYLTTIEVPISDTSGNKSNASLTVHKKLANELKAIFEEMASIKFPINSASCYGYRKMASGTGHLSHHSYGVAIDINPAENPAVYWGYSPNTSSPYFINNTIVEIWKRHGFYWGGDWSSSYYDPMHFSYTNH